MTKLKLKGWSGETIQTGKEKVIKLKEERELLGRFLIIQVPKLEESIGNFEMSSVSHALCADDGPLYLLTDKASL